MNPSAQAALQALEDLYWILPKTAAPFVTLRQFIEGAERDRVDAERYRWLRDVSEPGICAFYLSVGMAFKGVKFARETVDAALDEQISTGGHSGPTSGESPGPSTKG
jgi:hypothetical protein